MDRITQLQMVDYVMSISRPISSQDHRRGQRSTTHQIRKRTAVMYSSSQDKNLLLHSFFSFQCHFRHLKKKNNIATNNTNTSCRIFKILFNMMKELFQSHLAVATILSILFKSSLPKLSNSGQTNSQPFRHSNNKSFVGNSV
jgi:hypothetical protein